MMTGKRRNSRSHTVGQCVISQVRAPFPSGNGKLDGIVARVDSHSTVPDVDERANVTGVQLVDPDGFHNRFGNLFSIVWNRHHPNMGGLKKAVHMVGQSEYGGA